MDMCANCGPANHGTVDCPATADESGQCDRYAVVRNDARVPGGLRVVGRPTPDLALAERRAAEGRGTFVVLLLDVYARRTAALSRKQQ